MDGTFHPARRIGLGTATVSPLLARIVCAVAGVVSFGVQQDASNETDRMMEAAKRRFGRDFWRQDPTKAFGKTWTLSRLIPSARLSQARANLDRYFARPGVDGAGFVDVLRRDALAHPDDAVRLFKWGYGAFSQAGRDAQKGRAYWTSYDRRRELSVLEWSLAAAPSPNYDEHVRLRFLVEAGSRHRSDLVALGERLIAHKPSDAAVKRMIGYTLGTSRNPQDLAKAAAIADDLLKIDPDRLSYIALKQVVYETRWLALGNRPEDAAKGIEWARRYLSSAPANAANRAGFERSIKMMSPSLSPSG